MKRLIGNIVDKLTSGPTSESRREFLGTAAKGAGAAVVATSVVGPLLQACAPYGQATDTTDALMSTVYTTSEVDGAPILWTEQDLTSAEGRAYAAQGVIAQNDAYFSANPNSEYSGDWRVIRAVLVDDLENNQGSNINFEVDGEGIRFGIDGLAEIIRRPEDPEALARTNGQLDNHEWFLNYANVETENPYSFQGIFTRDHGLLDTNTIETYGAGSPFGGQ